MSMKEFTLAEIHDFLEEKDFSSFCDSSELDLSISYPSAFPNAKILREFTDGILDMYELPLKWKARLVLMVDELNNNAIEHGSLDNETNKFYLCIKKASKKVYDIHVAVTDSGRWEDAKNAHDMEIMRKQHEHKDFSKHHSIRGRWLFLIISTIVDKLYFKDIEGAGLQVGFEKRLDTST